MKRTYEEKGTYNPIEEGIDGILKRETKDVTVSDQIDKIMKELRQVNKQVSTQGFKQETPSIIEILSKTRELRMRKDRISFKIVQGLLKDARELLVFEDMNLYLSKNDRPKITSEDIKQIKIKTPSWEKSQKMADLIKVLEDISQYKEKPKKSKKSKKGKKVKEDKNIAKPIKEARDIVGNICVASKLIVAVKFLKIIAKHNINKPNDKHKHKHIVTPKDKGSGRDIKFDLKKDLVENDKDTRTHQLLYNLSIMVQELVDVLMVGGANKLKKLKEAKKQYKAITKEFDKDARVPTDINDNTCHASAAFLHLLECLKVTLDEDPKNKGNLAIVWKSFYKKTLDTSKKYDTNDKKGNSMLTNLKHYVTVYERTGKKEAVKKGRVGKEEKVSSRGLGGIV